MKAEALTVSELTRNIKTELESTFPFVRVKGEISNCKQHGSGHVYLTLKDEEAQISVVIWKNVRLRFQLALRDGLEVIVEGRLEVYPPAGRYQLIGTYIAETGEGLLQQELERRIAKLAKAGYFSPERKKPIPEIPETIGLITSPTGAVIEDMSNIFARRFPAARLLLYPVSVQGDKAVESVRRALAYFNNPPDPLHRPEVIILARGGGSSEDLQAFNDETVAEAIYRSAIPVISAIGHETDQSIADMVADRRAGTPSIAAELAVPDREDLLWQIESLTGRQSMMLKAKLAGAEMEIDSICNSYAFNRPVLQMGQIHDAISAHEKAMATALMHRYQQREQHLNAAFQQLRMLDLKKVLKRGFVLVSKKGKPVSSASGLSRDDLATLEFHDGMVAATITGPLRP
jgi:exodeoxyribonuclease VII large subunit